ncbi:MAG: KH domain-containing protein [Deltaproteobacteria bacterium]|nr:KH domain-containing protein [Deltaproteobacteria bacterium]
MTGLALFLAEGLASRPDLVSVALEAGEPRPTVVISASQDDVPELFGKGGRTIRAIRALYAVLAAKTGRRCEISVTPLPQEGGPPSGG